MFDWVVDIKGKIIAGLGIIIVLLLIWIWVFSIMLSNRDDEIIKQKKDYAILASECTLNAQRYAQDIKSFEKNSKTISSEIKTEIRYIDNFKGAKDETNCDSANRLLNSVKY